MKVADYKELRVYRLALQSAMQIFELSRTWPSEEKFSLTDQIRRSSGSVCTNLAEAWRKRRCEALRELPAEYFVEALERAQRAERESVRASERESASHAPRSSAPDAPRSPNPDTRF